MGQVFAMATVPGTIVCNLQSILSITRKPILSGRLYHKAPTPPTSANTRQEQSNAITTPVAKGINSLTLDKVRHHVVCRTDDHTTPILVYDYSGQVVDEVTTCSAIADGEFRGIAIDTKRNVYITPTEGYIVRTPITGSNNGGPGFESISVHGDLKSVAYLEEEDVYVIIDQSLNKVMKVDASTGHVTGTFGSHMSCPWEVTTGQIADINNNTTCIMVSDQDDACVHLFALDGTFLRSYSCGSMKSPWGVCVNPAGHVLVADSEANRVLAYSSCGDDVTRACDVMGEGKGHRQVKTWYMDYDCDEGVIVIGDYQTFTLINRRNKDN